MYSYIEAFMSISPSLTFNLLISQGVWEVRGWYGSAWRIPHCKEGSGGI